MAEGLETKPMTPADRKLTTYLLRKAADKFGNHGCNDLDLVEVLPDVADRRDLMRRFHEYNGDPEEFDPEDTYELVDLDWALMDFMADELERGNGG